MTHQRIEATDTIVEVIAKMSDRNFSAVDALTQILKSNHIDPDNVMGGLGIILFLDRMGIYGTGIDVLYNDICEKDLSKMIAVIRATHLGMFPAEVLKDACARQDYSGRDMVPVNDLYQKIKQRFPKFNS